MKAVILAAGKGTRLLPLTKDIPKTLIPVKGKPILMHIIESIPDEFEEIIIVVYHMAESIKKYIKNQKIGRKITFVTQGKKTGTLGALLSAKKHLKGERFIILASDDLHSKNELKKHLKYDFTFGVQYRVMPGYYSIELDKKNMLLSKREQNDKEKIKGALIATGVYMLTDKIFKQKPHKLSNGEYSLPNTIFEMKEHTPIKSIISKKWKPINTLTDLEKAIKDK